MTLKNFGSNGSDQGDEVETVKNSMINLLNVIGEGGMDHQGKNNDVCKS